MMVTIFDLTVRGALHLGEFTGVNREKALEWIPSDSLFAALVEAWAHTGAMVTERLQQFLVAMPEEPPFRLMSALPRAAGVRFYPAPPILPTDKAVFQGASHKKAKKVRWLSQQVLDALTINGDPGGMLIHGGSVWLTDKEAGDLQAAVGLDDDGRLTLWAYQSVPHVTVDRASSASNLFYTGRVTFGPQCGLWFAVRGETVWVRQALVYLQDAGLGGLRSTGHGAFTWEDLDVDWPEADTGAGLLLSRYAPASQAEVETTLQTGAGFYQFVTVGGWYKDHSGHPWRRRSVRMIAEGALLPIENTHGKLVDVHPDDEAITQGPPNVYRYGLAFFISAGKLAEVDHAVQSPG
jgi:CRISPR type III-A-associated RAMP protein Csm4